jgi:hypothetical protein
VVVSHRSGSRRRRWSSVWREERVGGSVPPLPRSGWTDVHPGHGLRAGRPGFRGVHHRGASCGRPRSRPGGAAATWEMARHVGVEALPPARRGDRGTARLPAGG